MSTEDLWYQSYSSVILRSADVHRNICIVPTNQEHWFFIERTNYLNVLGLIGIFQSFSPRCLFFSEGSRSPPSPYTLQTSQYVRSLLVCYFLVFPSFPILSSVLEFL